jgi:hypothetical protein
MNTSRLCLGMPLLVLLVACGDDRPDGDPAFTETETMSPATEAPPAGPATPPEAMSPAAMSETAELRELQGSGIGGEVTVRDRGAQSEIMVRLTGSQANTTHPGHIHSGTCDAPGGVVQALEPINADATGTGTMTTTVDLPGSTVMNGQHIVVYHGSGGTPATCAQIPRHM